MRISDWSSDVCSSDLFDEMKLRPDQGFEAGRAVVQGQPPARQEAARARTERPDKRCDIGEGGAAENILCCARAILAALDAESDNIYSERAQRDNFAPNKSVRGRVIIDDHISDKAHL